MERLKTSNISISNGSRKKVLTANLLQKLIFRSGILWRGSLKSLHTLFDKCLDHMLVKFLNKIACPELYKLWTSWQNVDTILEDVSVTETIIWCLIIHSKTIIFQCSKHYGSPTCVTRLKAEANTAYPISLNEKRA